MAPKKGKTTPSKRKADDSGDDDNSGKAIKSSAAQDAASSSHGGDPVKTLRFLLSDDAFDLITDDEVGTASERSYRMRPGELTAFEELVAAMLLAKPISHRLGLRAIKTLLNEPWSLNTPGKVIEAGEEKLYDALDHAKTQHKDKTAAHLVGMAKVLVDNYSEAKDDGSLEGVRDQAGKDPAKERELLAKSVKGVGAMCVDLFYRRMQAKWLEIYPFADKRTLAAAATFNLPAETTEELVQTMDVHWDAIKDLAVGEGDNVKAATFALLCDRAIAIELDKKGGRALEAIGQKAE